MNLDNSDNLWIASKYYPIRNGKGKFRKICYTYEFRLKAPDFRFNSTTERSRNARSYR